MFVKNNGFRPALRAVQSLVLCACMLLWTSAQAGTVACAKSVSSALLHNGVVAPGASTAMCKVGPVWTQVSPLEMKPANSVPDGFLYLAFQTGANRLLAGVDVGGDTDISDFDSVVFLVDADGSGSLTSGDFYIQVQAIPVNTPGEPIASGVACSQGGQVTVGDINYFQYNGTSWQQVTGNDLAMIRAAVKANIAYRYDVLPPVWNMEIDMPHALAVGGNTYFNFNLGGFGLGAYYYVDSGHQQLQTGTVLQWPDNVSAFHGITDPVVGNIDPTKEPDFSKFGKINLSDVCFDVNFTAIWPWDIGGTAANEGDHRVSRTGSTNFGVTYTFKGPGTAPGNLVNNGVVDLRLDPYGPSGGGHNFGFVTSKPVTINQFNQSQRVEFDINVNAVPQWTAFQPLNFVCATMTLHNFDHDDDPTNNSKNINYNYFSTSNYTHHFFVFGDDIKNLKPGETGTLFLRLQTANDPGSEKPSDYVRGAVVPGALVCLVALGLVSYRRRSPRVKSISLLVLVGLSTVLYVGCRWNIHHHKPGGIGTSRWHVKNAGDLGLQPVKGEPDLYQMPLRRGESKRLDLEFVGQRLPYTPTRQRLQPATAEGRPNVIKLPVKPGRVVSVLAFGNLHLDGATGRLPVASPLGIIVPGETSLTAAVNRSSYLLRPGFYVPNQYAGALIGSFDNFDTSFVVGRSSSIVVPAGAETLSLAVNARLEAYKQITGAYDLVIIDNPAPSVPTHTVIRGDATGHVPDTIPIWQMLSSLNVYNYYRTTTAGRQGATGVTMNPIGSAHYSIYETHTP
jgi:hypothetical protein